MLSGSDTASPSKPSTSYISKPPMTEQMDNSNNSSEEIASIVNKIESLKCSGQDALSTNDYEAAVEHFSNVLQLMYVIPYKLFIFRIEKMNIDSLHISLAPLYLAYGSALLQVAIQKSSDKLVNTELVPSEMVQTLVSGMDQKENQPRVIDFGDDVSEDEQESGEEEEDLTGAQIQGEADGESEENEQQQDEDDFGIAWEVLDTARVIYEKDTSMSSSARASKLVDVYCSLGDLSMENGTRTL